jgi:transketolase
MRARPGRGAVAHISLPGLVASLAARLVRRYVAAAPERSPRRDHRGSFTRSRQGEREAMSKLEALLTDDLVEKAVHTVRVLAADGVEKAASGHPGTPMALADITVELFLRHLRYDPTDPAWLDRDRFVLSCGHASMLLYSMLHLAGYDLSLEDLKQFRQWGSKTPGHPEVHVTPGVETTTGPLGQGISNAVGMATSIKMLAARAPGEGVVTARVFGICSDGDLQEGVASEAASLAGHLGLDNLIFFYDDNHISIDGDTALSFSEDVGARFRAYGWATWNIDGHDHAQIKDALAKAVAHTGQPKLIVARTKIGIGTSKENSHSAHGEPLGEKVMKAWRESLKWGHDPFYVSEEVRGLFAARAEDNKATHAAWKAKVETIRKADAGKAEAWDRLIRKDVPADLYAQLLAAAPAKEVATRVSSGIVEQKAAALVPSLAGGSADLNPSTKTYIEGSPAVAKGKFEGRNIHFGIREHAMGSFVNGMALTEGFIPFGSTFLVFSDYMRPTIRLAALSHMQSIFVFTHDSVYLGEDGPTHQPVEHYWALRLIPRVHFFRPADGQECAAAWAHALERRDGPTVMALSRQNLPVLPRGEKFDPAVMRKGAYVVADADGVATMVIIATGSEVGVALEAKKLLDAKGEKVRVVSAPCLEVFAAQDDAYRTSVLPGGTPRVAIEIGVTAPWRSIVGDTGLVIGHDAFGASAPAKIIQKEFGFAPDTVAATITKWRSARA